VEPPGSLSGRAASGPPDVPRRDFGGELHANRCASLAEVDLPER
jgi:hypothetical protein